MATMYISKITPLGSSTTYNIKDLEAIQSIATGDSNGQIKITPRSGTAYNVDVKNAVTFTKNTNVTVAGTSKDTYKYDQSAIFAPNGLIMGGTAAAAGLVTRGICGVSTPDATTGAANKDNLYINFDGTTTYSANRQLVLQAGTVGDNYGNNVYQYAAVRGDAMKAWVEAKGYITSFTDTLVKQTAKTNDANYKILLGANTNPTSGSAYEAAYDSSITINPSTHTITATTFSGNATSATGFASAKSIALTGDITGSATGGNGSNNWSIATTIGTGKVTNAMLAGSIANSKLANSKVTIADNDVSLGGSLTADTLRTSLGLSNAMHFIGVTSTALSDGAITETLTAKTTGSLTKTTGFVAGDVVIDTNSNYEYVWTGAAWERLGPDGSYKVTQTAYTDSTGTAETDTATRFVYSVSQDANGVVSFKTRSLPTYNNYSLPLAANETRGGIQIGYSESGSNYAVKLSSEKAYVTVPWTDTKVTSVDNHYTPETNNGSELTASLSGTAGAYAIDTEYTVLTGVKAQRDAKGHVTGLTYTAQKIKDTNTTYTFDGTYNASTNKAATVSTVTNAINALDVSNISGFGAGKTLKTLTETNGKIAATFQDISITKSQVTDFPTNISAFTNDSGYITSADVPESASAYAGTISAIGTVASTGTNNGFARGDHIHNITKATINSVLGTGSGTAKFYREDGTWATPAYTTNTDEKLKIAAVTSGTTYYPIVAANSTAAANRQYDSTGFAYLGTNGTTSAVGVAKITLGNSTASGTANNKQGSIVLYGSTAYATTITPGGPTAARTITLPNATGTVALAANPTIATDSGTATVSLVANTTYKLTAGGGSLIFKTPADGNTDTKVNVIARGTTKSYLLATTTSPTSTATGVTAVAETGVYLDTTAAKLVATTFKGALEGNATSATKATQDSDGNAINTTYVKKSGDTMTGALVFNSSANNTYPYTKRTDIDSSVTSLSSAKYAMLTGVKDNNDAWIGYIENMISTSGENQLQVAARKSINGSNVNNALALKVAANGTKSAVFESDVLPKTNNALNLGNSSYKWKDISATYLSGAFKQTLNLYAKDANDTAKSFVEIYARNYLGNISGQALYSVGSTTNITAGQWQFREYSPNSPASATSTGKYEQYSLPNATSGLSATQYYDILTTKLHFINKTVATNGWTGNDTTYSGFPYKANITCTGVTANHVPNVIFDYNELISGNFCPFADSSANTVSIYCKTQPTATITIPTIYCT